MMSIIIGRDSKGKFTKDHIFIPDDSWRKKQSIARKDPKCGCHKTTFKKGIIPWIKGKHHSEKSKQKWRLKVLGRRLNPSGEFKKGNIPWNKGKPFLRMRGESHPNWKGGFTPLRRRIEGTFKYRQWRSDVFTRDDFTCQNCGRRGGKLNVHHVKPFAYIMELNDIKTFEQAMDCEELWDINNGITCCKECHSLIIRKEIENA